jgi:hypothetical protein
MLVSKKDVLRSLAGMKPGECRFVGREDVHVYCHGTRVDGKYDAKIKSYRVVTRGRKYDSQDWVGAEAAALVVLQLLRI